MYILAKFAGWQIDHPMELAMQLWNRVSFEKKNSRRSIAKTLNAIVRARVKMIRAGVLVDYDKNLGNLQLAKASWFREKFDLDRKIQEDT